MTVVGIRQAQQVRDALLCTDCLKIEQDLQPIAKFGLTGAHVFG
jgi:hypothetical protein